MFCLAAPFLYISWRWQGTLRPVRVASGSMAETLLGPHYRLQCRECSFPFRFDAMTPPQNQRCVCPNCGFARNRLDDAVSQPGERVIIDRLAWQSSAPQRWQIAAYACPIEKRLAVKRIVALPGETVAIRRGDLFIDGRLAAKPMAVLRELAVLVFDDDFRLPESSNLSPRWRPRQESSGWRSASRGFVFEPAISDLELIQRGDALDWLDYHHWSCSGAPGPRDAPAPVRDNDGYNQGLSRTLNDATDLLVTARVRLAGRGVLAVAIHDGREWLEARLDAGAGQAQMLRQGKVVSQGRIPGARDGAQRRRIEFAVFDQQAIFALDGVETIAIRDASASAPFAPLASPVALGAGGLYVEVDRLTIHRDVYYLDPLQTGRAWSRAAPLGDDECFLLGDNPPVSIDSRHLPDSAVPAGVIRGRVTKRQRS
jgi:signal peptidase I